MNRGAARWGPAAPTSLYPHTPVCQMPEQMPELMLELMLWCMGKQGSVHCACQERTRINDGRPDASNSSLNSRESLISCEKKLC